MRLLFSLTAFIIAINVTSCITVKVADNNVTANISDIKKPKNIIFMVGDGMGLSQVSADIYYNKNQPSFERFSVIGLSKTSSGSDLITDSAAGATAFSAGLKTYNGAIGVDMDTISQETILERVSKRGLATGLVSTSSIVHATPASFFAHVKKRSMYNDIATFMPKSGVDFFAGGGLKFFSDRKDGRDLLQELRDNGYNVETQKLPTKTSNKKEAILLAADGMPKMSENRGEFLPDATKLALEKLSKNKKGFFIMIEGSQIDWGGHNNDADYLISELLDFDKAINAALDFAEKDGETLVIVTADHETGGFTLATDNGNYNKVKPSFSTSGHSGTMVPVFAKGPGANLFNGIYENTEIYEKMKALLDQ